MNVPRQMSPTARVMSRSLSLEVEATVTSCSALSLNVFAFFPAKGGPVKVWRTDRSRNNTPRALPKFVARVSGSAEHTFLPWIGGSSDRGCFAHGKRVCAIHVRMELDQHMAQSIFVPVKSLRGEGAQ